MRFDGRLAQCVFFVALLLAMIPSVLLADTAIKVAVLYPQVNNSVFGRVFDEIIAGIRSNDQLVVATYPLSAQDSLESLRLKLRNDGIETVIALGQKSYSMGQQLASTYPVVHGGVLIKPNGHSGISLVIDPEQFFSQLVNLAPSVKRVYTVYSEVSNGWLIRMAHQVANQYGIELHAYQAGSLREGMHELRKVLGEVHNENDAVWLLLDRVVPSKAALPIVLEKAWDSRVVVFSNNPSHTRRGALFALYPNNQEMGGRLGQLAIKQSQSNAMPLVLPSQNLNVSVNERTASHLGFSISQSQRGEFDLIYPVQ